jgi:arabinofuranosyltransferase
LTSEDPLVTSTTEQPIYRARVREGRIVFSAPTRGISNRDDDPVSIAARASRGWFANGRGWKLATSCLGLLFVYLFVVNAWIVDESYITFRTVDNFLNGYGLTWNTGERVQAYTHPMWMFLMAGAAFFTAEYYVTSIVVSLIFSLLGLVIARRLFGSNFSDERAPAPAWKLPLFILLLCCSKAYIDFGTSGLENPLSHFLVILFTLRFLKLTDRDRISAKGNGDSISERDFFELVLIASVSAFNRLDTILLFIPALVYCVAVFDRQRLVGLLRVAVLGSLPISLWLVFSVVYYGFPFPNTYYAKLAASGASIYEMFLLGANYFGNSVRWDFATQMTIAMATIVPIVRRHIPAMILTAGVWLYLIYVLLNAASATHMSGRFFSVPFVIAAAVAVYVIDSQKLAALLAGTAIAFVAISDRASIKFGTDLHAVDYDAPGLIDTKLAVYQEGAALLNYDPNVKLPNHPWYSAGLAFRSSEDSVAVYSTPGYFGFAAGPNKWIIDQMGLCDPLLGRIAGKPHPNAKGGHFMRDLPSGYLETVAMAGNHLSDPMLREYYDALAIVTQGPVFTSRRFSHILDMNLGRYDHLLRDYATHVDSRSER